MLARSAKPKLTLSLAAGTTHSARPTLSLKSPMAPLRSPMSPMPNSPTSINTKMNQRGLTTAQQPTYAYVNTSTSRSILKKGQAAPSTCRRLQFSEEPEVHCVTPIDDADYYGAYKKTTREERRWISRP